MPFRDDVSAFTEYTPLYAPEERNPGFNQTLDSAFALENDVANAFELLSRPTFQPNYQYDLGSDLKAKGLWEQRDGYIGSRSAEETDFITNKRKREQEDREILVSAGIPGIIAAMGAGLMSPTTFLPLVGPTAKGVTAVKQGIGFSFLAAGIQESVLYRISEHCC